MMLCSFKHNQNYTSRRQQYRNAPYTPFVFPYSSLALPSCFNSQSYLTKSTTYFTTVNRIQPTRIHLIALTGTNFYCLTGNDSPSTDSTVA